MSKNLHIVSFDVPYPPDYGGVIDVYYKLKYLYEKGIRIHLHCFEYGRGPSNYLKDFCEKVSYYPRAKKIIDLFSTAPFIVHTRKDEALLSALNGNDAPILFEGLHTCAFLNHPSLKNRTKAVRMHNIEWKYYKHLSENEEKTSKKIYFQQESFKLRKFEKQLKHAQFIYAISPAETTYLKESFDNVYLLPVYHDQKLIKNSDMKNYFLYQGNLSVNENIQAVESLLNSINLPAGYEFIIAGKDPSDVIIDKIKAKENFRLIANPDDNTMQELMEKAKLHVLITQQETGIKLKLLNALYTSAPVLTNQSMVTGTGLSDLTIPLPEDGNLDSIIEEFPDGLNDKQIKDRMQKLKSIFNLQVQTDLLIHQLFSNQ